MSKNNLMWDLDLSTKYLNICSDKERQRLVHKYGNVQKRRKRGHVINPERRAKHSVQDMKSDYFYTLYVHTDFDHNRALIGDINHAQISKVNLSHFKERNYNICNQKKTGYFVE